MKAPSRLRLPIPLWSACLLASTAVAVAGFVAFAGCTLFSASPSTGDPMTEIQRGDYQTALRTVAKMKRRGELPGIEPSAAGTFAGTWLWYDPRHRDTAEHVIRVDFHFADGRPRRTFNLVSSPGTWGPVWHLAPAAGD